MKSIIKMKKLLLSIFLLCSLFLWGQSTQEQYALKQTVVLSNFAEGYAPLPYRLYRSDQTASMTTEAVPLVVFLHGAGERGCDNSAQLRHCIPFFLDDTITSRYPFLLLVPQCPDGKRWINTDWSLPEHRMESEPTSELLGVMHLVDSLIDCEAVDPSRVYISGISMGGFGVWDALQRWPDKFAAAIPICGGGDPAFANRMKDVPSLAKTTGDEAST